MGSARRKIAFAPVNLLKRYGPILRIGKGGSEWQWRSCREAAVPQPRLSVCPSAELPGKSRRKALEQVGRTDLSAFQQEDGFVEWAPGCMSPADGDARACALDE